MYGMLNRETQPCWIRFRTANYYAKIYECSKLEPEKMPYSKNYNSILVWKKRHLIRVLTANIATPLGGSIPGSNPGLPTNIPVKKRRLKMYWNKGRKALTLGGSEMVITLSKKRTLIRYVTANTLKTMGHWFKSNPPHELSCECLLAN